MSDNRNFRDVNSVEELQSLDGNEKFIMNSNGSMRQASTDLIKSAIKRKRELVYEWNPGIDANGNIVSDIYEFAQNIDDDLTWMIDVFGDTDFEVIITAYGIDGWDSENDCPIVNTINKTLVAKVNKTFASQFNNISNHMYYSSFIMCAYFVSYNNNDLYNAIDGELIIGVGGQFDSDNNPISVRTGGCIECYNYSDNPIKSIQIYKISN